jgi:pyruvate/2-oxoglutarate dehydrogenase complex dihydrolipoamide acyltransferase (E2) component
LLKYLTAILQKSLGYSTEYWISTMTEIKAPTIPGAGTTLSIGRWFKRVGDPVTLHEPLVEIDTDNVTHEIRTPVTGVLSKILVKDGGTVEPGAVLGRIDQV